jgi:hypothetical protein
MAEARAAVDNIRVIKSLQLEAISLRAKLRGPQVAARERESARPESRESKRKGDWRGGERDRARETDSQREGGTEIATRSQTARDREPDATTEEEKERCGGGEKCERDMHAHLHAH